MALQSVAHPRPNCNKKGKSLPHEAWSRGPSLRHQRPRPDCNAGLEDKSVPRVNSPHPRCNCTPGASLGPATPLSRHLATLAESVVNTNLYNKQYNDYLKKFIVFITNSFKSSLYCLLYKLVFTTLAAKVARWRDNGPVGSPGWSRRGPGLVESCDPC